MAASGGFGRSRQKIQLEKVPIDPAAQRLAAQEAGKHSALEHALTDGEDFELVLAVPPAEAERLLAEPASWCSFELRSVNSWTEKGFGAWRGKPAGR